MHKKKREDTIALLRLSLRPIMPLSSPPSMKARVKTKEWLCPCQGCVPFLDAELEPDLRFQP